MFNSFSKLWFFAAWLLIAGVNVDQVDKLGRTALFTACLEGHENVAELLLRYGADVNLSVFTFPDQILCF